MAADLSAVELYTQNEHLAEWCVIRMGISAELREDMEQEARLALWRACQDHNPTKGRLATLAARYMRNHLCNQLRQLGKAAGQLLEAQAVESQAPTPAEAAQADEQLAQLAGQLEQLDERKRLVFELRYGLNGRRPMTGGQIARAVGLGKTRVYDILRQVRGQLHKQMSQ